MEPRRLLQSIEKRIDVLEEPEYRGLQFRFTTQIYLVQAPLLPVGVTAQGCGKFKRGQKHVSDAVRPMGRVSFAEGD